jgi:hypothetical protein
MLTTWHSLSAKVGIKRLSFGGYSSLADQGHGLFIFVFIACVFSGIVLSSEGQKLPLNFKQEFHCLITASFVSILVFSIKPLHTLAFS